MAIALEVNSEFDAVYRLEHEAQFTPERSSREADALIRALNLRPGERILDVACGWGRHLKELKLRGFTDLTGVDVQGAFLEPIARVKLLACDATALDLGATFDAAYCVANGFFSEADSAERVLWEVAHALKPKGRFLLDTTNHGRLVQAGPTRSWRGGDTLPWILEESHFDLRTGAQRLEQRRILEDGRAEIKTETRTETRTLTRFHYTLAETVKLFCVAGLSVREVYGDWTLEPYTLHSPRMIVLADKEAAGEDT